MKLLLILALVSWTFFPLPPKELRGGGGAIVYFAPRSQIETLCRANPQDRVVACANPDNHAIVMPNPCEWPVEGDAYAELLCHELGHAVSGWRH
jgi:hypothetical protein